MTVFPAPDVEVLPASRHTRMRWANGGGWTTEIIAQPSSAHWDWRLSVADVEVAGPFSSFPGIDRSIALLRGGGFALTVGDHDEQVIDVPFRSFDFSGDETTSCRLIDGPVQDLNLMTARTSTPRRLAFIHVPPASTIAVAEADVLLVVAGTARIAGHELGYLDAIRCTRRTFHVVVTSMGEGTIVTSVSVVTHG